MWDFLAIKLLGLSDSLDARLSLLCQHRVPLASFSFSPKTWLCAWHMMDTAYIFLFFFFVSYCVHVSWRKIWVIKWRVWGREESEEWGFWFEQMDGCCKHLLRVRCGKRSTWRGTEQMVKSLTKLEVYVTEPAKSIEEAVGKWVLALMRRALVWDRIGGVASTQVDVSMPDVSTCD